MHPVTDDLLAGLRRTVGDGHVLTDPQVTAGFCVDWTGRFRGSTPAVVRPGSTAEVAAVLVACTAAGQSVVVQGGNTGLVGGSVPLGHELVLSLTRLDALGPVDVRSGQVTAGAGVTLAALQQAVRAAGWEVGVDLAARDSCTVGGMIATNAGGVHVLAHGTMRAQVLGVEAVLADGTVVSHLAGLVKDNTGYDLGALLCGSEGTLAVITAARLRLVPSADEVVVAVLGLPSWDAALDHLPALRRVPGLRAAEAWDASAMRLVCDHLSAVPPVEGDHAVWLLLEAAGAVDPMTSLAAGLESIGLADGPVAVAVDAPDRARLWRYRESITEAISARGVPVKLDVSLPAGRLGAFAGEVGSVVGDAEVVLFGHAGDGNLHVNVLGALDRADEIEGAVLGLVAAHDGSISAEHGIGTAKRRYLHLSRSAAEIATMRRMKHALDPAGTLNPGVLLVRENERPEFVR